MCREIELLRAQCRAWGGDIIEVSGVEFVDWFGQDVPRALDAFSEAPFTSFDLGVHWSSRTIIFSRFPKDSPTYLLWVAIVHEMGHVFACPDVPENSNEFSFFGWEHQLVKHVVGDVEPWYRGQRDYGVDGGDFGDLPREKQEAIVQEKIAEGIALGILDENGVPQALTRPTLNLQTLPSEVYARVESAYAKHSHEVRGSRDTFDEGVAFALREAAHALSTLVPRTFQK